MRIVFFGTSDFAVPALEALHKKGDEIVAIVTTPDEPVGRKKILTSPPVKVAAEKLGLEVFQPKSLRNSEFENYFKISQAELGVVASYGKIISKEIIELFPKGLLNIHPSLLPKYRGPSPIQAAILNGEKETGVTIMLVDEEVDHGPILKNIKYRMSNDKYFKETRKELAELGSKLLIETLPDYLNGKIIAQEQDHSQATFTKKISREDGKINWCRPATEIFNQIRALNPEPGTWTRWKGQILNVLETSLLDTRGRSDQPGQILRIDKMVAVATTSGYLELKVVQLASKRPMPISSFLNGHLDLLHSVLE